MNLLFPCHQEFEKDSLYNDLKNEFQKNEKYVKRQKLFGKLISRNAFAQLFSLILISRCIHSFSWRESGVVNVFKVMELLIFAGVIYLSSQTPVDGDYYIERLMLTTVIFLVLGWWTAGFLLSQGVVDLAKPLDHKGSGWNYRRNVADLKNIYPDFFVKTLNRNQLVKLKNEIDEYEFADAFSYSENGEAQVTYGAAMGALYEHYYDDKVKEKTNEEIAEEKARKMLEQKAKEIYRNL